MISHSDADNPQLMRLKEVCSLLSISRATVYRWVDEGSFPNLWFWDKKTVSVVQFVGMRLTY